MVVPRAPRASRRRVRCASHRHAAGGQRERRPERSGRRHRRPERDGGHAERSAWLPRPAYDDTDPSALTDFHQTLDSHGTWVEDPTYGTVWVPAASEVGPGYTPYSTAGHWAYDANDDYVWVSDYDWGWAPYHYGRWVEIEGRGWSWIPGRTYRGAWVTWGADDGYGTVGWAPMGPEYVWRGGVAVNYTYSGPARWSYVGRGDVFASNVGAHIYTGSAAAGVAGRVHPTAGRRWAGTRAGRRRRTSG